MARLKDAATLTGTEEDLICRLADMADIVRGVRAAGAAMPIVCLADCDPRLWITFGAHEVCANCSTRPLAADQWHRVLTARLRVSVGLNDSCERCAA